MILKQNLEVTILISSRLESFQTHLKNTEYKGSYIFQFELEQNCKQEKPIFFLDYGFLFFIKLLYLKRIVPLRNSKWKIIVV